MTQFAELDFGSSDDEAYRFGNATSNAAQNEDMLRQQEGAAKKKILIDIDEVDDQVDDESDYFKCAYCPLTYKSINSLDFHHENVHSKYPLVKNRVNPPTVHDCPFSRCDASFDSNASLNKHASNAHRKELQSYASEQRLSAAGSAADGSTSKLHSKEKSTAKSVSNAPSRAAPIRTVPPLSSDAIKEKADKVRALKDALAAKRLQEKELTAAELKKAELKNTVLELPSLYEPSLLSTKRSLEEKVAEKSTAPNSVPKKKRYYEPDEGDDEMDEPQHEQQNEEVGQEEKETANDDAVVNKMPISVHDFQFLGSLRRLQRIKVVPDDFTHSEHVSSVEEAFEAFSHSIDAVRNLKDRHWFYATHHIGVYGTHVELIDFVSRFRSAINFHYCGSFALFFSRSYSGEKCLSKEAVDMLKATCDCDEWCKEAMCEPPTVRNAIIRNKESAKLASATTAASTGIKETVAETVVVRAPVASAPVAPVDCDASAQEEEVPLDVLAARIKGNTALHVAFAKLRPLMSAQQLSPWLSMLDREGLFTVSDVRCLPIKDFNDMRTDMHKEAIHAESRLSRLFDVILCSLYGRPAESLSNIKASSIKKD